MTLVVVTKTTMSVSGLYVLLTVDGDPELSLVVVISRIAPLVQSLATVVYSIRDIVEISNQCLSQVDSAYEHTKDHWIQTVNRSAECDIHFSLSAYRCCP